MSNITISRIKPEIIDIIWTSIESYVQLAIDESNGELQIDVIKKRSKDGNLLLISIQKDSDIIAVLSAEVRTFETGKKVLHIMTAGGKDLMDWIADVDVAFTDLARSLGCSELYIIGRPGWAKVTKSYGYELIHTTLSKKVGG